MRKEDDILHAYWATLSWKKVQMNIIKWERRRMSEISSVKL